MLKTPHISMLPGSLVAALIAGSFVAACSGQPPLNADATTNPDSDEPIAPTCATSSECASGICFGACLGMTPDTVSFEDGSSLSGFGHAFDADATTMAVGVPLEGGGAVRVYERIDNSWHLRQKLLPARTGKDDFGSVVALQGDILAVSAPSYQTCTTASCQNHGYVIVFERANGSWTQTAMLQASEPTPFQTFGGSLAIQGSQLLVGAVGDRGCGDHSTDVDCTDVGAVYVFDKTATGWQQTQKLKPRDAGGGDSVGFAISIEGDVLAIGAPGHQGCATGVGEQAPFDTCSTAGAIYMYESANGQWQEDDRILFRRDTLPSFNGRSLRLSGGLLTTAGVAGGNCPGNDPAACVRKGILLVFEHGATDWQQTAVLESDMAGVINFALAYDAVGTEVAVATTYRVPSTNEERKGIELFHKSGEAWSSVGVLEPQPSPFPASINISAIRIEQAGVMFSTPRAIECVTDDPACRFRGTIVTWPY